MSKPNWNSENSLAADLSMTASVTRKPVAEGSLPPQRGEVVFNKVTDGTRRHLDLVVLDLDDEPVHHVLDRDGIERMKKFLTDL